MNEKIKLIGCTVASFFLGSLTIVGANQAIQAIQNTEIKVSLNGQIQDFKDEATGETQYPITYNDRTYLPLRNVAQLAGLDVDYDSNTNTAILKSSNNGEQVIKELYPNKTFDYDHFYWYGDENTNVDDYYTIGLGGDDIWAGFVNKYKASSALVEKGTVYSADNLKTYYDLDNCWAEGADGSGIGETITVTSFASCEKVDWPEEPKRDPQNHQDVIDYMKEQIEFQNENFGETTLDSINNYHNILESVGIINGYAKNDETWLNNNRVKKLKLTINDDAEYILNLEDSKDMQRFDIHYECELTKKMVLKFEILEVYKGEKYDDTCLTTLYVDGCSDFKWRWKIKII